MIMESSSGTGITHLLSNDLYNAWGRGKNRSSPGAEIVPRPEHGELTASEMLVMARIQRLPQTALAIWSWLYETENILKSAALYDTEKVSESGSSLTGSIDDTLVAKRISVNICTIRSSEDEVNLALSATSPFDTLMILSPLSWQQNALRIYRPLIQVSYPSCTARPQS